MACYPSRFTSSGIFCCESEYSSCDEDLTQPPKCPRSTNQCSSATGGGCCRAGLICSPNGCVEVRNASTVGLTSSHAKSVEASITVLTGTVTVTENPASTETYVKGGEISQQKDGARKSMVIQLNVSVLSAVVLLFLAAVMGSL